REPTQAPGRGPGLEAIGKPDRLYAPTPPRRRLFREGVRADPVREDGLLAARRMDQDPGHAAVTVDLHGDSQGKLRHEEVTLAGRTQAQPGQAPVGRQLDAEEVTLPGEGAHPRAQPR